MLILKGGGQWVDGVRTWYRWLCDDCQTEIATSDKIDACQLCAFDRKKKKAKP